MKTVKLIAALCVLAFFMEQTQAALTVVPVKRSVEVNVADTFSPLFRVSDTAAFRTSGPCSLVVVTPPTHGNLSIVYGGHLIIGVSIPRFAYSPAAGFTGRDRFVWKMALGNGDTATTTCKIVVHPKEPGGMTVLLCINKGIYPSITTELNQFKTDLESEGYVVKYRMFTSNLGGHGPQAFWDSLVTEYEDTAQFLAGAIYVGRSIMDVVHNGYYTYMTEWAGGWTYTWPLGIHGPDSTGYTFGRNTSQIWVSRISAPTNNFYGDELMLTKRYFKANHDYRTGAHRVAHTAYVVNLLNSSIDYNLYLQVFPEVIGKAAHRADENPMLWAYNSKGGEVLDMNSHGAYEGFMHEDNDRWIITPHEIFDATSNIRIFLNGGCWGMAGDNSAPNCHLFTRGGASLFATGCAGSNAMAQYSFADPRMRYMANMRAQLAKGERYGRAWIRSGMAVMLSLNMFGDPTIRPNLYPANQGPAISSFTADDTAGQPPLTVNFTAAAAGTDTTLATYEWFPEGFNWGINNPVKAGLTETSCQVTYTKPYTYEARVEVMDHYLSRRHLVKKITVAPPDGQPFRVNCGRVPAWFFSGALGHGCVLSGYHPQFEYSDGNGNRWLHEQAFVPGGWGYETVSYKTARSSTDSLNGSYAYTAANNAAGIKYRIPLKNGNYRLTLGFADYLSTSTSVISQTVKVEGAVWRTGLSGYAAPGPKLPYQIDTVVALADGELEFTVSSFINWFTILPEGWSEADKGLVSAAALAPSFGPNPFGSSLHIRYGLAKAQQVRIDVVDQQGRLVRNLGDGPIGAGKHGLSWNGKDASGRAMASGVYLVRIRTAAGEYKNKVLLLK